MRACPSCGSTQRRQVAPAFYECVAPEPVDRAAVAPDDPPRGCGAHYMDSGSRSRPRWVSDLFGT